MACITDCEILDLNTSDDCNLKGGIKVGYWAKYSDIDWVATAAGNTWDATSELLSGYVMNLGATWKKINFTQQGSLYTQSFNADNSTYEVALTFLFKGKGRVFRNAMCQALKCCKFVVHLFDRNCGERVFGVDWDGDAFNGYIDSLRITTHDDNSGEIGGDNPQDIVVMGGEADCPAIYAEIGQTNFETTYL